MGEPKTLAAREPNMLSSLLTAHAAMKISVSGIALGLKNNQIPETADLVTKLGNLLAIIDKVVASGLPLYSGPCPKCGGRFDIEAGDERVAVYCGACDKEFLLYVLDTNKKSATLPESN